MFQAPNVWRRYSDELDPNTESIKTPGCARALEGFLLNGLNATNLLVLTGAGSSFCIRNQAESKVPVKTAPRWSDLWQAVEAKVGAESFASIIAKIPNGKSIDNIEKLLTQCKLFVALFGDKEGDGKSVNDFIAKAETAILGRVDFVDGATDLDAHEILLTKIARRGIRKPRAKTVHHQL